MVRAAVIFGFLSFTLLGNPVFGTSVASLEIPIHQPEVVAYSPSSMQIAVGGMAQVKDGSSDSLVVLVNAVNGDLQDSLRHSGTLAENLHMPNPIHDIAYSPDGKQLAVASRLGLKLWNLADGKEIKTLLGYGIDDRSRQIEVTSIAYSPDGALLAAASKRFSDPNIVQFWNLESLELVGSFEIGYHPGYVAFLPDGTMLVSAEKEIAAVPWDLSDGKQLKVIQVKLARFVIDRQGKYLASVNEGSEKMWRIEGTDSGNWRFVDEVRLTGQGPMSAIGCLEFSPDGRLLATTSREGALIVYNTHNRQVVGTLLKGGPFAFSPDEKSIAVAQYSPGGSHSGSQLNGTELTIWNLSDVLDADRLEEQARTAARVMVNKLSSSQAELWYVHAGGATMDMLLNNCPTRPDMWMKQTAALTVLSGPQAEAATPILIEALKNPLIIEKSQLLHALGLIALRESTARNAILQSLRKAEAADTRTMAATMLALLPANLSPESVPVLVDAILRDESPHVRAAAERTLQLLDPKAFEQATKQSQTLGVTESRVKRRDGKLFYQDRTLEEWLGRLSASFMPNEIFGRPSQEEPLEAIQAFGPSEISILLDTLNSDAQPLRRAAAVALGRLGPQSESLVESLLEVISAAKSEDLTAANGVPGGVATDAADSLAILLKDQPEPPPSLVKLTNADHPAVRISAARAVAEMNPRHPRGVAVLRAALDAADTSTNLFVPYPWYFQPRPKVTWLGRVLADEQAPTLYRVQAAKQLQGEGANAISALSSILQASTTNEAIVSQHAIRVIHKIGPTAIRATKEALQAAQENHAQEKLAAGLWGLGSQGQIALKELLQKGELIETEPLWWAVFSNSWDDRESRTYQTAVREALEIAGQSVPPLIRSSRSSQLEITKAQSPELDWYARLLADAETPPPLRQQASRTLANAPREKILPLLPNLLKGLQGDHDRTNRHISEVASVIHHAGPQAIPAMRKAIEQASTDSVRQDLLQILSTLGVEGQDAFQELSRISIENDQGRDNTLQTNKATAASVPPDTFLVTFQVEVPASTPPKEIVYLTGSDPALKSWNPQGVPLIRQDTGNYEVAVQLPQESRIEYKVTRGNWATVEKGAKGAEIPNRVLNVNEAQTVTIRVVQWRDELELQRKLELRQNAKLNHERAQRAAEIITLLGESSDPNMHAFIRNLLPMLEQCLAREESSQLRVLVRAAKLDEAAALFRTSLDHRLESIIDSPQDMTSLVAYIGDMYQAFQQYGQAKLAEQLFDSSLASIKAKAEEIDSEELTLVLTDLRCQTLAHRITVSRNVVPEEVTAVLLEIKNRLGRGSRAGPTASELNIPMQLGRALERNNQRELAAEVYHTILESIEHSNNPALNSTRDMLQGVLRRLELIGKPLELAGTTMDGSSFDWASYRGKVVLVDFWATWCGPCRAELPNLKLAYQRYHKRGFDVVGISVDNDREALEKYVESEQLPWVTLHEPEVQGRNPIAQKYGISSIPTVLLVDREGKVVSLNARDDKLPELLEQLIGPPETPVGKLTTIDLQPHANQMRNKGMHNSEQGNNLDDMRSGEQTLAGVRFDIGKGLIFLRSSIATSYPAQVGGIVVQRRFDSLYILQGMAFASHIGFKEGATIGSYQVNYEDKSTETIPIVYGEDVRDWWNRDNSRPVSRGTVAWIGKNPAAQRNRATLRLYMTKWVNPHPEKRVTSIDFISDNSTAAAPFCVAMTVEALPVGPELEFKKTNKNPSE